MAMFVYAFRFDLTRDVKTLTKHVNRAHKMVFVGKYLRNCSDYIDNIKHASYV